MLDEYKLKQLEDKTVEQQKELLQNWIDMYKDAIVLNKGHITDEKLFYYADQIVAIARYMEKMHL